MTEIIITETEYLKLKLKLYKECDIDIDDLNRVINILDEVFKFNDETDYTDKIDNNALPEQLELKTESDTNDENA